MSAPLITHRFPIERAQSAYDLITGKSREPFLGVVIQYSGIGDESRTLAARARPAGAAASISVDRRAFLWVCSAPGCLLPARSFPR